MEYEHDHGRQNEQGKGNLTDELLGREAAEGKGPLRSSRMERSRSRRFRSRHRKPARYGHGTGVGECLIGEII